MEDSDEDQSVGDAMEKSPRPETTIARKEEEAAAGVAARDGAVAATPRTVGAVRVGSRIEVWWPTDERWYRCVSSFRASLPASFALLL